MCRLSKLIFCILCSLLTQQLSAQWQKINFSYHKAEYLTSVIRYNNTFTVDLNGLPIEFVLQQNTPNPFNPSTKINYVLPSTEYTSLKVYNSIGQLVSVLVDEVQNGGEHTAIFNAEHLSAGIYFYQIQSGSILETKKMVLIK